LSSGLAADSEQRSGAPRGQSCQRFPPPQLVVSEGKIKTHVAHIRRKIDVRDRVHAVIYA
jgi:hypothetical protein